jgi:hypothetical protein
MTRTNVFHLGKKAYIIPVSADKEIILFGATDWNEDGSKCELSMHYRVVEPGTELELSADNLDQSKKLFIYNARSAKFRSGEFTDFDSRRYLKSRYRNFTRELFRQQSPDAKLDTLYTQVQRFHTEQNRNEQVSVEETANTAN